MITKLQEFATGRLVLLLFIATMTVYSVIIFYSIPVVTAQAPGLKIFDMSPTGYSFDYAKELLESIGPVGREFYLTRQLPIDFIYPGLFSVTYTLMLIWLFGKRFDRESRIFWLALIPALAGTFDYLENIGIILMLKSFPNIIPSVVQVSSLFSIVKSIMTTVFYILLLFGLLMLAIRKKEA